MNYVEFSENLGREDRKPYYRVSAQSRLCHTASSRWPCGYQKNALVCFYDQNPINWYDLAITLIFKEVDMFCCFPKLKFVLNRHVVWCENMKTPVDKLLYEVSVEVLCVYPYFLLPSFARNQASTILFFSMACFKTQV